MIVTVNSHEHQWIKRFDKNEYTWKTVNKYILLEKKRNFNVPIFSSVPGFLTLTKGHVDFVKWAWEWLAKDLQKLLAVLSLF